MKKFLGRSIFLTAVACFGVAAMLTGCQSNPVLTREAQLALAVHSYSGVTPEQAIDAAQRVLTLVSDDPVPMFANTPEGFTVTLAKSKWTVTAKVAPTGTTMFVQIEGIDPNIAVAPTTARGVYAITAGPATNSPFISPAAYHLWWARMDYMLHKTDAWTTCKQARVQVKAADIRGNLDILCGFTIDDWPPNQDRSLSGKSRINERWYRGPRGITLDRAPKPN